MDGTSGDLRGGKDKMTEWEKMQNVWLGGDVKILAGVSIGDNTVIGAGSIVTKNIPSNVIAAGNPCKVLRNITEADKTGYLQDKGNSW